MQTAKVFQSGNSQAIRIPNEYRTDEKEFIIKRIGNCFYLLPTNDPWALLRETIGSMDEDIAFDRNQPSVSDLPAREEL